MTHGHSDPKNSAGEQRGAMSSHPADSRTAQGANVNKLEKEKRAAHAEPVEQHRSSRRPRQRTPNRPT